MPAPLANIPLPTGNVAVSSPYAESDAARRARMKAEAEADPLTNGTNGGPKERQAGNLQSYGGSQKAFADEALGLRAGAQGARDRGGYALDEGQWSAFGGVDSSGRADQSAYLGMLRGQMDTSRQSVASNALLAGAQQGQGLQTSLAGLARGGPVGALAARDGAAMGNALSGQQAIGQAQALRAQEAAQASSQYGAASAAMVGADQAAQRQGASWAEDQARARLTNAQQNAARERSFEGLRQDVLGAQQKSVQQQSVDNRAHEQEMWGIRQGDAAARSAAQAAVAQGVGAGVQVAASAAGEYYGSQKKAEEDAAKEAERRRNSK